MLVPSFVTGAQAEYLTKVSLAVKRSVEAVYRAWFIDPALATLLPFNETEEEWIRGMRRETVKNHDSYLTDCSGFYAINGFFDFTPLFF